MPDTQRCELCDCAAQWRVESARCSPRFADAQGIATYYACPNHLAMLLAALRTRGAEPRFTVTDLMDQSEP